MKKGTTLRSNIEKIQGAGPKQYQQGWTEFYKLKFKLTPDVLIPRPETELLVDEVLKIVRSSELGEGRKTDPQLQTPHSPTILDIGTGSGCIAIAVAKNLPQAKIIATDISPEALKVAEQNAKFHKVEGQIIFLKSDLLSFIPQSNDESNRLDYHTKPRTDIMVANLPYIPTARLMQIDPLVSEFEPKLALDGGQDGFELYRRLFQQMQSQNLYPKVLLAEIDSQQGEIAIAEANKYFPEAKAEIKKDLAKLDRILIINFSPYA